MQDQKILTLIQGSPSGNPVVVIEFYASADPAVYIPTGAKQIPKENFPHDPPVTGISRGDTLSVHQFAASSSCVLMNINGTLTHVHIP